MSLRRSLYIGGSVSLLLIIIVSSLSVGMFQRQAETAKWVTHTYMVLNKIKDVRDVVFDMETSRRGYRSTNEPEILAPYHSALKTIGHLQTELEGLVTDNQQQLAVCNELETEINKIISFWNALPIYRKDFPLEEKLSITRKEDVLMANINSAIDSLTKNEKLLLEGRTSASKDLTRNVFILLCLGVVLTIVIIIVMMAVIRREFDRRLQFQLKLRTTNKDLQSILEEKKQINAQLERFTYVVAHDLKSPIAGSMALATFLAEDKRINVHEDVKEVADMLFDTMNTLNMRITSVLDYSRNPGKQQQLEQVDTRQLVANIQDLLFVPDAIKINIADNLPTVLANEAKLQQVFQNLMSNAVKYNDKQEGLIEIGCHDRADFYEFYVKDNGPGIKGSDRERIFDLYEVTDNESHRETSTGIGLNLLKTLVEEQGGRIWVESVVGEGATFCFLWRK